MSKWDHFEEEYEPAKAVEEKKSGPAFRELSLGNISPSMLFNRLNGETRMILMDVRDLRAYSKKHIRSSYNVATNQQGTRLVELSGCPLAASVKGKKKAGNRSEFLTDMKAQAKWNDDMWMGKTVVIIDHKYPEDTHPVIKILRTCYGSLPLEIVGLEGGVKAFADAYPFMCTTLSNPKPLHPMPWEIVPGEIYLGRWSHATDTYCLDCLNITHAVTIHADPDSISFPHRKHMRIINHDSPLEDVTEHFEPVTEFVKGCLSAGGSVLIHCGAGQSRSVTLVCAVLMMLKHMTMDEAMALIKECHPAAQPNTGLARALDNLDRKLYPSIERRSDRAGDRDRMRAAKIGEEWQARREQRRRIMAEGNEEEEEEGGSVPHAAGGGVGGAGAGGGGGGAAAAAAAAHATEDVTPPTSAPPPSAVSAGKEMVVLRCFKDGELVDTVALRAGRTVVGRSLEADLRVDHASCSRKHAVLIVTQGGEEVMIEDLESAHCTTVNDAKLTAHLPTPLRHGHTIRFGDSSRVFVVQLPQKKDSNLAPTQQHGSAQSRNDERRDERGRDRDRDRRDDRDRDGGRDRRGVDDWRRGDDFSRRDRDQRDEHSRRRHSPSPRRDRRGQRERGDDSPRRDSKRARGDEDERK